MKFNRGYIIKNIYEDLKNFNIMMQNFIFNFYHVYEQLEKLLNNNLIYG